MMKQRPPAPDDARPDVASDDKAALPDFDPIATLAAIRAAAGSWHDLDIEALKVEIYRAREEGTRPPDR